MSKNFKALAVITIKRHDLEDVSVKRGAGQAVILGLTKIKRHSLKLIEPIKVRLRVVVLAKKGQNGKVSLVVV